MTPATSLVGPGGSRGSESGNGLSLLLVEDDRWDATVVERILHEARKSHPWAMEYRLDCVDSLGRALMALAARPYHVALLDLGLPDAWGTDTLLRLVRQAPDLPVIVLTGMEDDQLGCSFLKMGAQDYLFKRDLTPELLLRSVLYAVERWKKDFVLERAEDRYRAVVEAAPFGMLLAKAPGNLLWVNEEFKAMVGQSGESLSGRQVWEFVHRESQPEWKSRLRSLLEDRLTTPRLEARFLKGVGGAAWGLVQLARVSSSRDEPDKWLGMVENLSERKSQ